MHRNKPDKTSQQGKINRKEIIPLPRLRWIIALAAIVLYGNTVNFNFTLDDDLFYLKHKAVQKGIAGIPEIVSYGSMQLFDGTTGIQPYRPLTLLSFAVEKSLFNNSPVASHLINLLLYILVLQVLFSLLLRLFSEWSHLLIGLIVLLYAAHPVHTEVVSSVKSRDELLAALFGFLAWSKLYSAGADIKHIVTGCLLLFLAMLSKESAIAFIALIPMSAYILANRKLPEVFRQALPLIATAGFFMLIRYLVIGSEKASTGIPLMENVLNGAESFTEAWATRMVILFHYLRLTIAPWPLNWDYSYNQIPITDWGNPLSIAGLLVHAGPLIAAFIYIRKAPVFSFCIFFYLLSTAPTNNLFFINGATIGERFLFVPSLAICIAVVAVVAKLAGEKQTAAAAGKKVVYPVIAVLILFAGMTLARSNDWKDNLTLFTRGVEVSPNSSRTHYSLASELFRLGSLAGNNAEKYNLYRGAMEHFNRSLEIYPDNFQALYNAGLCYAAVGDTLAAISNYKKTVLLNGRYITAMNNLGVLYQARGEYDSAYYYYKMAYDIDPTAQLAAPSLSNLLFAKGLNSAQQGNREEALRNYKESIRFVPGNTMALNNIASLYASTQQYDSSLVYLKMGYAAEPGNRMIMENIAAVSYLNRNYAQAIEFAQKALASYPGSKKSINVLIDTYRATGNLQELNRYQQLLQTAS